VAKNKTNKCLKSKIRLFTRKEIRSTFRNTKKCAFVAGLYIDSKMSELELRLTADATVRAKITSDAQHVVSVYDFINLLCDKRERFANKVWERLISEDSVHKDELDELFTVEYVNGLSCQIDN